MIARHREPERIHFQRMSPQHHFEQQNIPKIIPRAVHCVAFFYLREVVMSKKYEYSANDFTHTDSTINVCVCVAPSNFNLLSIFTISVPVEKKDGEDIDYYRAEAIKKAKEVIADIAEDAALSDPHQNTLQERVTVLEKQLTGMQAAMSCKLAPSIGSIDISELKKSNGSIVCRIGML